MIKVAGLPTAHKVVVVDESRKVESNAGSFSDSFGPLAVHIYRIANGRTSQSGNL